MSGHGVCTTARLRGIVRRHFSLIAAALILLAAVAAYWPSLASSFHLDDRDTIVDQNLVTMPVERLVRTYPTRWLVFLTFKVQEQLFGRSLPAYHVVNTALHALNAWLVMLLVRWWWRPLRRRYPAALNGGSRRWLPLVAGLLFAVHPLQSQAVIYITQRFTLLGTLCYLVALGAVARGHLPGRSRAAGWVLAAAAVLAGTCCKEIIVTAPVLVACMVWLFFAPPSPRSWSARTWCGAVVVVLLVIAAPIVLFLHLSQWNMTLAGINFSAIGGAADTHVPGLTRRTYALTQASVLLRYLARAFWPAGLVIDADVPLITTMRSPVFLGSCSLIAASLAVAWLLRRRTPLVLWGMVVFYVALLPQSSIMPTPDLMFEHRAYLSLAGVIWAVLGLAAAWSGASRATRYAGRVVVGAVIIILAAATFARGMVWRDELTLWRDAYAKSPHKQRVLINYANALVETGRVDEACTLLERAAGSWDPMMPEYAAVLATAYGRAGRLDAAIRMAALACTHDPRNPAARFNLAFLYYAAGSNDSALAQVDCLLATTPDYADAWYLSGLLRATINGQYHSATNHLHTYLRLQPQGEHQREATQLIELLEQRGGGERQ